MYMLIIVICEGSNSMDIYTVHMHEVNYTLLFTGLDLEAVTCLKVDTAQHQLLCHGVVELRYL